MTTEIKFGTDGWRGVVADDFTYVSLRRAAAGVAAYLKSRHPEALCVVGYDCRFASENFAAEVARVLAASGVRALLFDRPSPTQVASWTVIDRAAQGAVVITASHNPYVFNGLKYKPETGSSAPPGVIAELEGLINRPGAEAGMEAFFPASPLVVAHDPLPSYLEQLGRMLDLKALAGSGLRLVHEVMHGSGYGYLKRALDGGSAVVEEIHADRNPFFGGVNPEPIPANLAPTREALESRRFDLCVCTDGDADRVGIIDETGRFVNQLQVFALLMRYLVEVRGMKGPVVRSLNMTHMADRLGEIYGLPVHEVPVGFKNIAPKMMATEALLGGEESGGYAVRGHIPERDGILVGLMFADMLVRTGRSLGELLDDLAAKVGAHFYARQDVQLARDSYPRRRAEILGRLAAARPAEVAGSPVQRVRDDDGIKYYLADGSWVLLRASGTEPLIRIYAEASSPEAVQARLEAVRELAQVDRS